MADISFDHDELRDIAYGIKDDLLQELKDEVTDQIENEIAYAKSDILDDVDFGVMFTLRISVPEPAAPSTRT